MIAPDARGDFDAEAAERLLCLDETAVTPELAPLATVLRAAAATVDLDERVGEEQALAAFRAAMIDRRVRVGATRRPAGTPRVRAVAAVLAGGLVMTSGAAAAAATGYLPEPVQRTAKELLQHVGIEIPPPVDSGDQPPAVPHPDEPATRSDGAQDNQEHSGGPDRPTDNGEADSSKGAEISEAASDGRSHAGDEHHPGSSPHEPDKPKVGKPAR